MSEGILYNALHAAPEGAGISRYTLELARELAAIREDVTFAVQQRMADRIGIDRRRLLLCPDTRHSWQRNLREQLALVRRARRFRLVHYPDSFGPMLRRQPSIITVHDLSFLRCAEIFTWGQTAWKRWATARSVRRAARAICVSQSTARDVVELLGAPEDKLRVIHSGVRAYTGAEVKPDAPIPNEPFILCVGTLQPRKNIGRLLEAVSILHGSGIRYKLVLAGSWGWMPRETLRPGLRALERHLVFAGYCDDARLKWLYARAAAMAYVSLYEGFGFPPLEAMGYGVPVVVSRSSCLPEICGDAAHYVDPLSAEDIARGLRELFFDRALRLRLLAAGREQVKRYDWRQTALAVSRLYDEV